MRSFRIFNRRAGSIIAAATMVFATMVPGLAAAATVTERSISLGNTVKDIAGVSYNVKFKAQTANTGAYVVDFCTTAAINTACTTPSGFTTASVGGTSGSNTVTSVDANTVKVVLATPVGVAGQVDDTLTNLHNPTGAGVFYARIITYADDTALTANYVDAATLGTYKDDGGVAMSTTDGFGVSGRALETLVFCAAASGDTIGTGCSGTLTSPSLVLGSGGVLTTTPSTGTVKTQVSTNATSGVIVSLKSNTTGCGGLSRQGATSFAAGCGISPITTAGSVSTISGAQFGLKLANLGGASSTTTAVMGSSYDTTNYYMNYVGGDASGVTGPYGDPIYKSVGPVSDGTANLVFGAAISPITPAGSYSASLNLIATGTF